MSKENFLKQSLSLTTKEAESKGGIMPVKLAEVVTYGREPSLFDETYITERDKKAALQLRQSDLDLGIERNHRAIILSVAERRVVAAISYLLSQDLEADDIQEKIKDPRVSVERAFRVGDLAQLIYGKRKEIYKESIITALHNLHRTFQVQVIEEKNIILRAPLISIVGQVEDTSQGKQKDTDIFLLKLGTAFFYELNTKYLKLVPEVFVEWRKNGRQTQLYAVLLFTILRVHHNFITAAKKAEAATRVIAQREKLSDAERDSKIAEARREALSFSINIDTLLNKIETQYKDKKRFKAHLESAVEGLKELGLVDSYEMVPGKKGQKKLVFILSDNYINRPKLLEYKKPKRIKSRKNG